MENLKNKSLILTVLFLSIGCSAFLSSNDSSKKEMPEKVSAPLPLDSRCSFEKGFKDSQEERRSDDLCYLLEKHFYWNGFLSGISYLSRKAELDSLLKIIQDKENRLKDVARFLSVSVRGWRELSAFQNEISELKKEQRFIEEDMNSYRLHGKY